MRTKRKRILRMDLDAKTLTEDRYHNLTSEMNVILDGDIFPSREDREVCYWHNKKEIMERWLSDPTHFCRRPFCFWQFESLPERKLMGKHKWWNPIDHSPPQWELSDILEEDHQLLLRLGLLQEKEMERCRELEIDFCEGCANLKDLDLFFSPDELDKISNTGGNL